MGAENVIRQHVEALLLQFRITIKDRLNSVSPVVQIQINQQVDLVVTAHSPLVEDPCIPSPI